MISKRDLIDNDLFITPFYDDWQDYRDGFRDWFRDYKKIKNVKGEQWSKVFEKRIQMNKKQKKLLQRRKAKRSLLQKRLASN